MAEAFVHRDRDPAWFTLHDSIADRMELQDGVLSFRFPDGIWALAETPVNPMKKIVRTDEAWVRFELREDDIEICVLRRGKKWNRGKYKLWKPKKFMKAVNSGKFRVEFLYRYVSGWALLIQCVVRSEKKPHYQKCIMEFPVRETEHCWNVLREEYEW